MDLTGLKRHSLKPRLTWGDVMLVSLLLESFFEIQCAELLSRFTSPAIEDMFKLYIKIHKAETARSLPNVDWQRAEVEKYLKEKWAIPKLIAMIDQLDAKMKEEEQK